MEAQLTLLAKQAERAVRRRSRYYGPALTNRLLASIATLLNHEEFEGEIPDLRSLGPILRAAQIVGEANVSLGVSDTGHFTAIWNDENRTIYVEAISNFIVNWAIATESEDSISTLSSEPSTLVEFSGALG